MIKMTHLSKAGLALLISTAGLMACGQSSSAKQADVDAATEIFAPGGKAIRGYDAVAFFKDSMPVLGADSLAYEYKNAKWFFSSGENREAFIANPEKYAPQYGGYCAYGTADGHKAPTETGTWTIVNNKLYFNYNSRVKKEWAKDRDALIIKADSIWPTLKNEKE